MAGKGLVSAAIDASSHVAMSLTSGQSLSNAVTSIDLVSVGGSFVAGALTMPGVSTTLKTTAVVGTALIDAAVDINASGTKIVGGQGESKKPVAQAGADLLFSATGSINGNTKIPFTKGGTPLTENTVGFKELGKSATPEQKASVKPSVTGATQGVLVGNNGVINTAVKANTDEKKEEEKPKK